MIRRSRRWGEHCVLDVEKGIKRLAREWGEAFRTSYEDYRRKLRAIHEATVAAAGFDLVLNSYDAAIQDWIKIPGAIIYPTDDDDWVSCQLAGVLRTTSMGEAVALRWQSAMLYEGGLYTCGRHRRSGRYLYSTNNYAIKTPCLFEVLNDHVSADERFAPALDEEIYIDEILSINNKNLGSLSFERNGRSLVKIAGLFKKATCPHNLPTEFHGVYQCLSHVYSELIPRRLF